MGLESNQRSRIFSPAHRPRMSPIHKINLYWYFSQPLLNYLTNNLMLEWDSNPYLQYRVYCSREDFIYLDELPFHMPLCSGVGASPLLPNLPASTGAESGALLKVVTHLLDAVTSSPQLTACGWHLFVSFIYRRYTKLYTSRD